MKRFCLFITVLISIALGAQYDPSRYPVIPKPQTLLALSANFPFSSAVTIVTEEKSARKETEFFRKQVAQFYNINLRYERFTGFEPYIYIQLDSSFVPAEGYRLIVTKQGIDVYGTRAGVFYGLQTLLQLIQKDPSTAELIIPGCSIIDYPRFAWRGMHLDVTRHFFPKDSVKMYLRYMAMYKLNTFHWHLTDDQGWRIEIKRYPLLTQIGAWRNATLMGHYSEEPDRYDSTRYGGFYTQEEVREIVAFADSLHITVVPEIEMPGHARAMIAAYPTLGDDPDKKLDVACTWGVFTEVLSPKPQTFTQLEGILDEVVKLFPSQYVHIGGDECPKEEWKRSTLCQQLIKQNNLKDEHGLQSWFVRRIVNYLASKNKKAIGWDEILEGGLADGAAVMSWRGEEGGIAAAKQKHHVVMSPGGYCYFDHYQSQNPGEPLAIGGFLPIEKVYSYNPVPAALTNEEKKYIMGVQANVWTEYIPTFSQVEYMIFPRMAALAEVAWTKKDITDFNSFVPRVTHHMGLYDKMKVNYSRALFEIKTTYAKNKNGKGLVVSFSSYASVGQIRFARNENVSPADTLYTIPIVIDSSGYLSAALFVGNEKVGPVFKQFFLAHEGFAANITLRNAPSTSYNTGGALTLVDGNLGRSPWTGSEWLGWWGDTLDALIDLGSEETIWRVAIRCLQDPGSWIYSPTDYHIYTSQDGIHFHEHGYPHFPIEGEGTREIKMDTPTRARFIRVVINGSGLIPEDKSGAGHPAWLFVSEIIVN